MDNRTTVAFDDVGRDSWLPREPELVRLDFATEKEASAEFRRLMAPYFWLVPEMQMEHFDGTKLRMDFVGVPKVDFPARLVGFEIKRGFRGFKDVTQATKQAIDYRHSRFIDRRGRGCLGEIPKYVLIFPMPIFNDGYNGWIDGAVRTAGKFNVGFIDFIRPFWLPRDSESIIEFRVSATPIWRSDRGTTGNGATWTADRGRGSR